MNNQKNEKFPENYQIIFHYLDEDKSEINEINVLRKESEKINEIRIIAFEVSEPEYSFGIAGNFNSFQNYRIIPNDKK